MSNILFLIAALAKLHCQAPEVENFDGAWVPKDTQVYTNALTRCTVHFGEAAPCLNKFIKKDEGTYYAICGHDSNKLRHSSTSGSRWFTISAIKGQEPKDYVFGGPTSEVNGCGRTCPLRPTVKKGAR